MKDVDSKLLEQALSLPPAARASYIRQAVQSPEKAEDLLKLLAEMDQLGSFLEQGPGRRLSSSGPRLSPGTVLGGRFEVKAFAGRGGMGEVYQAQDKLTGETVALKICRHLSLTSEESAANFMNEVRLATRVGHQNVCRIHNIFSDPSLGDPSLFFTMEWLEGQTLAAALTDKGKLGTQECLSIVSEIAEGLAAIHQANIIHQDLKPGNIFLVTNGESSRRPVITDFGLAQKREPTEASSPSGSQIRLMAGTPDYMAPEQFRGLVCTPATDVYALGLIFFEMLCGKKPFSGGIVQTAIRRVTEPPPPLEPSEPIPAGWQRCLEKALAKDARDRYKDSRAFAQALQSAHASNARWNGLSRRQLIAGFSGVVAVASTSAIYRYRSRNDFAVAAPLLMLTNTTSSDGDQSLALSATIVDKLLTSQLAQSDFVSLAGREQVQAALRRMPVRDGAPASMDHLDGQTARGAALRLGGNLLLFSSLSKTGDERILRLRLERLGDSTETPRAAISENFSYRADADLPSAVYDSARWLRRTIGESEQHVENKSRAPEEFTTSSWQALKEYALGDQEWKAGRPGPAILHLKSALAIDDQFAMAAARLADILMSNGQSDDALNLYHRAVTLLTERNLSDRESLRTRGLFFLDTGQNKQALELFQRYQLEYPKDALPKFYAGSALDRLGRQQEAYQSFSEAVRLSPANYVFWLGRAQHFLEIGDIQAAEHDLSTATKLEAQGWCDQMAMAIAFCKSDMAAANDAILRMRRQPNTEFQSKSYALEACLRAENKDWQGSESALIAGLHFDESNALPKPARLTKKRLLAQLLFARDRAAEAQCVCRDILLEEPGHEMRFQIACLLAKNKLSNEAEQVSCGQESAAAALQAACGGSAGIRAKCATTVLPAWPIYQYWSARLKLELALADNDPKAAAKLFAIPDHPANHVFPDYLFETTASKTNQPAFLKQAAACLKNGPGRWWYEPEQNAPGFYRSAAEKFSKL